jgi:hypothetical protein
MQSISWDISIVAALGLLLAYSLLIRKHKALATLLSVYIAYLLAATWGSTVTEFFSGDRVIFKSVWIQANATPFAVESILLVAFTFFISAFMKLGGKRSKYSIPEVVVYAVSTLALAVMFMLSFMTPDARDAAMHGSKILPYIYQYRQWILGVPIALVVFFGIYTNED